MRLPTSLPCALVAGLAALSLSTPAGAQSFNVDLWNSGSTLPSTYGGAGSPGVWNTMDPPNGVALPLVDTSGSATSVTLTHQGFANSYTYTNPAMTGNDALLLEDGLPANDIPGIMRIKGLAEGTYDVIAYGIFPVQPTWKTGFLTLPGAPSCGGVYTGGMVQGVTHVRVQMNISAGAELRLDWVYAGPFGTVGFFSGFQLQKLCAPTNYCTAGTSASGCQATLSASGTASATASSGFVLTASTVEGQKDALFYYGSNGRQANPWGNGSSYQCVAPPVRRTALILGNGTKDQCDGSLSYDLNARWTAKPGHNPGVGAIVQAQLWYRDPKNTSNQTTSLSDAIEFCVEP